MYGCLVDACESGRQWILALQLLREMPKQQVATQLTQLSISWHRGFFLQLLGYIEQLLLLWLLFGV